MALILFEDIFDVKDIDPDGKKFERGAIYYLRPTMSKLTCRTPSGPRVVIIVSSD